MRGYRVGIVNPRDPFGARIRELLEEQPFPVTELKLFESETSGGTALTHFQDEVVVTQPLDEDVFPRLDLCFFAGRDDDVLNRLAEVAAETDVLSIVHGAVGLDAPVMAPGLNEVSLADRIVAVPRIASYLLGAVAKRVHDRMAVRHVSATLLLPAGEQGAAGADELHQQVVNLLNFKEPPTEVFREQLAFNVRVAGHGPGSALLAQAVAREAGELSALADAVTVNLVTVPVFHGYAASIWIEPEALQEAKAIAACFGEPPFHLETGRRAKVPTPVSVAESSRIHVGAIRRPGEIAGPGFWVWVAADTTAYDPGRAAIDLARTALT